jgi:DNA-binding CsgD family transcriptional regulator
MPSRHRCGIIELFTPVPLRHFAQLSGLDLEHNNSTDPSRHRKGGTPMSDAAIAAYGAPAIVFVQGAWADGSGWAGVIATLPRADEALASPPNSLRDLSGTIDELRRVVGALADGLLVPEQRARFLAAPEVPAALPSRVESHPTIRPTSYSEGLSGRELDVLRLVADGLTNAQIAVQLFLSPKTVSSHLVSIFGKLGVNSRAAATRLAIEQGLT